MTYDQMTFDKENWIQQQHLNPLLNLGLKLKKLKVALKSWNWEVFGDLNNKIRLLNNEIMVLEDKLQAEDSTALMDQIRVCKEDLALKLDQQLLLLEEKANLEWIKGEDRNSTIFHAAIKANHSRNKMQLKMDNGTYTEDRNIIGNLAAAHFEDLFSQFSAKVDPSILKVLNPCITDQENLMLIGQPTMEEIKDVIDNMSEKSAPGPDGFTGVFYTSCWDIIKVDVVNAIQAFFQGFQLPRIISSTALVLLPKKPNASKIADLRPISLCNFIHKIISKILNDRLLKILVRIISPEQAGFLPSRSIHENMALVHDLMCDLNNEKARSGNIVMQIDMSKAYDCVSWHFVLSIFESLGFDHRWIDLIYRNLSNCWYSIRWDGGVFGYFKSNRGVRQGDPLSPSLFILSMEVFSRILNRSVQNGLISLYYSARGALVINHLLYADDMLIFSNGHKKSIKNLLLILEDFCKNSGQMLNAGKSSIFISNKIDEERKINILQLTKFSPGKIPITYLGAPLFYGRVKIEYFDGLVIKVTKKIQGWMTRLISMGGRIVLIQAVLASIPIHQMAVLAVPKGVLDKIERCMANFLWDQGPESRRHWISWGTACLPKEAGGLGFRSLKHTMDGLHAKLVWRYLQQESLWAKYMRSKYHGYLRQGSASWQHIRSFIPIIQNQSAWIFGDGETKADRVLEYFDSEAPAEIAGLTIARIVETGKIHVIKQCLPNHAQISHNIMLGAECDKVAWTYAISGKFCIKTFLYLRRQTRTSPIRRIWQPWISPRISVLAWKLCNRGIATDDRVAQIGFSMASKCLCCSQPKQEMIEHLFVHGDAAMSIWSYFEMICDKPKAYSIAQLFRFWIEDSNVNTQFGCLSIAIYLCGVWEIWKERNRRRHDLPATDILALVKHQIRKVDALVTPKVPATFRDRVALEVLGVKVKVPLYVPKIGMAWNPRHGITVNLEISGDARKGSALLRDLSGSFIYAFVANTNGICREANFLYMIRRTIDVCRERDISFREIQCSSTNVCLWLSATSGWPWLWTYDIRFCRQHLEGVQVNFIHKKVNRSAAALTKLRPGAYATLTALSTEIRAHFALHAMRSPVLITNTNHDPG